MDWLGDLFNSPYTIIMIMVGVLAVLTILAKSTKARKLGKFCGWILVFCIWLMVVDKGIMPVTGLDPISADYQSLRSLLSAVPFIIFILKL